MKIDNNFGYELASAITASKNNRVLEWTINYLQSHKKNQEVLKDIQKRKIVKALLIEYPLILLERTTGPQNGESEPESLPKWLARVKTIKDGITQNNLPPPLIATDFWQKLYMVDGNHRHDALLKSGFKTYWTIFILENHDSEKKVLEGIKNAHMNIKAIIVDVGGVLVQETNKNARKIWQTKLHLTSRELTKEVYRTGKASLATIGKINPEEI